MLPAADDPRVGVVISQNAVFSLPDFRIAELQTKLDMRILTGLCVPKVIWLTLKFPMQHTSA